VPTRKNALKKHNPTPGLQTASPSGGAFFMLHAPNGTSLSINTFRPRSRRDACDTAHSASLFAASEPARSGKHAIFACSTQSNRQFQWPEKILKEVPFGSRPISGESVYTLLRRNYKGAFSDFGYSAHILCSVLEASRRGFMRLAPQMGHESFLMLAPNKNHQS
jgi:hypothetical protein